MNDRKRILDLVEQGKLTPEQAEMLLDALGKRKQEKNRIPRPWDVRSVNDLKKMGTQLSNTVSQSLTDVRKTVENELKVFSTLGFTGTLTASKQIDLPETVKDIWVETRNGQVQVHGWEKDFSRIIVRGQIRTNELESAEQQLNNALQATDAENRYHLTILHDAKTGVVGASVEVYMPANMESASFRTVNGELQIDDINTAQLRAETSNGSLWIYNNHTNSLYLTTDNGGIDIHQSLYPQTQNVYAATRNGTIVLEGIASELNLTGVLKTAIGGIHVSHPGLRIEYIDPAKKMHARLFSDDSAQPQTHVHCETRNGSIYVRE